MRVNTVLWLIVTALSCSISFGQRPRQGAPGQVERAADDFQANISGISASSSSQERPPLNRLAPSASPDLRTPKPDPLDEELLEVVDRVEETFRDGDVDAMVSRLGPNKIFASFDTRGSRAGYYTRPQLRFMIAKLFDERETRAFKYSIEDIEFADVDRAFLRSEWTYMLFDSDTLVTESLRFQFERDRGRWHISEIKASRR